MAGAKIAPFFKGEEILVRLPNWVGDAVMATPVLLNLTRHHRLALLGRPALLPLFRAFPGVSRLLPVTPGRQGLLRAAKAIRRRFEAGILLPNSFSSALLFFWGRVKKRAGYRRDARSLLLTHAVKPPKEKLHQRDYYLRLLEALGYPLFERELRLFVSSEARKRAEAFLVDLPSPRVALAPGAAFGPAKKWPLSRFRALAYQLRQEGFSILVLGGAREREAGRELIRDLPRSKNLCGLTDLATAAALIEQVDLFVSNDSGLMHVAAALKRPQVAIFGSTDPEATGPLNPHAVVVRKPVECSPCFSRTCSLGYECFSKIHVSDVLEACRGIL